MAGGSPKLSHVAIFDPVVLYKKFTSYRFKKEGLCKDKLEIFTSKLVKVECSSENGPKEMRGKLETGHYSELEMNSRSRLDVSN